jgi:glyoxylase-like metal-dependent hydrolase (beta-lactamase superfamily II)
VPYIEGAKALPARSVLQRVTSFLGQQILSRQGPMDVMRALEDRDVIQALGGLQVSHTPGHTPGSLCLYQPRQRILFCGDLLFNRHPLTGQRGLRLAIPMVSLDMAQVRESVRRVAALPVEVLCPGHGEPITQGAAGRMQALLGPE